MKSEKELAAKVVDWLKEFRWEVYQEVSSGYGNPIADIVATQGNISWIIETKMSLSMALLEQADQWRNRANYVSIATPALRKAKGHRVAYHLMQNLGIGYLTVSDIPREALQPRIFRNTYLEIKNYLTEEQKTYAAAGTPGGGHWTPFKRTCELVKRYVEHNPGCTLKQVFDNVEHHYYSGVAARSAFTSWIDQGLVEGIYIHRKGRFITLHTNEQKSNKNKEIQIELSLQD